MMKTYEESFVIRSCDCDISGKWRLSAILATMQEVSGEHSMLLGCGREELLKQQGAVWVLSRCEMHIDRYPAAGEKVTISTFPMPTRLFFFPRYYILTDAHGEMIGKAGTLWLLMDIHTRKMLPPGDVARLIPDNRDLSVPMNLPATVANLQGEERVSLYNPVYSDLDVNGHVNNTRYADWLCNVLDLEVLASWEPESIILNYHREILPGQTVTFHRILKDNQYRLAGYTGTDLAFEIGGQLRSR